MNTVALEEIGAGFSNESIGSQQVFRAVLEALSRPGLPVALTHDAEAPTQGHASSAALLLALLDPDCQLWLSPSLLASTAPTWLRFHTGCVVVDDPSVANFLWFHQDDALIDFSQFSLGTESYPDHSATVVVDMAEQPETASRRPALLLAGPGIKDQIKLALDGLRDESFETLLNGIKANRLSFPRGVDVLLTKPTQITGLARTTFLLTEQGVKPCM